MKKKEIMSVLDSMRKGFGFLLMSFGISRPTAKAKLTDKNKKSPLRAFWDFFILFSGISTASNLSRTQPRPVRDRGLFLFRGRRDREPEPRPNPKPDRL